MNLNRIQVDNIFAQERLSNSARVLLSYLLDKAFTEAPVGLSRGTQNLLALINRTKASVRAGNLIQAIKDVRTVVQTDIDLFHELRIRGFASSSVPGSLQLVDAKKFVEAVRDGKFVAI